MKNTLKGLYIFILMILTGCAIQQPVKVDPSFWNKNGQKIGLAIMEIPVPMAHKEGQQGLLDIAINSAMAGSLESHLSTVDVSSIKNNLLTELEDELRRRGQTPVRLSTTVMVEQLPDFETPSGEQGYAKKDLRRLAGIEPLDAILLLGVKAVGTIRSYYGFVPTGAPAGYVFTENQMVNATNNKLIWYLPIMSRQPIESEWDEPPNYPNVDRAITAAITQLPSKVVQNLFSSP